MKNVTATAHTVLAFFINPPGETVTRGGLIKMHDDGVAAGIKTRFFRIHSVGTNNCVSDDVKPGDIVAVPHGRWSRGFDVDHPEGKLLYSLDPKDILGVYDGDEADLVWG